MNVHNIMEDVVIKAVNNMYDRVKGENVVKTAGSIQLVMYLTEFLRNM